VLIFDLSYLCLCTYTDAQNGFKSDNVSVA
jgi:hypothetical protein